MILGIILAGMFVGGAVAIAALIAGQTFWLALALYAGCGILAALAGAAFIAYGERGGPAMGRVAGYGVTGTQRG